MQNFAQTAFPDVATTSLPIFRPATQVPAGQEKLWTILVAPGAAAGGGAGAYFGQANITYAIESERDVVDARERLRHVFNLLTDQPARITASDFRRDYAEAIGWVERTGRPAFITNHGKPEGVLLSFSLYGRVLKGISRVGLRLSGKRTRLAEKADQLIEAEARALTKRLRRGE